MNNEPKLADVSEGRVIVSALPLLKVIDGEMIVHLAYKVIFEVVVTTPPTATFIPVPAALVFHPANV